MQFSSSMKENPARTGAFNEVVFGPKKEEKPMRSVLPVLAIVFAIIILLLVFSFSSSGFFLLGTQQNNGFQEKDFSSTSVSYSSLEIEKQVPSTILAGQPYYYPNYPKTVSVPHSYYGNYYPYNFTVPYDAGVYSANESFVPQGTRAPFFQGYIQEFAPLTYYLYSNFIYKFKKTDFSYASEYQSKAPTRKTFAISISDFSFLPETIAINTGDTIVWTNKDSSVHTASADNFEFDSGTIMQGSSFSHTFNKKGVFYYYCKFHQSMRGRIIVN